MPPSLLIATGNRDKAREIAAILRAALPGLDVEFLNALDLPRLHEPEETGETFEANARLKAVAYARQSGRLALADDSGLVVDALGGRPGVFSARYAPTSADRIARVLRELEGTPPELRTARFACVAALADANGNVIAREGRVEGWIADAARGTGGFGYDPIFEPQTASGGRSGRTLGQFADSEKHAISHRARALQALAPALAATLRDGDSRLARSPDSLI